VAIILGTLAQGGGEAKKQGGFPGNPAAPRFFYPYKLLKLCQLDKKLAGIGKIFLRWGKNGK
jgi:hypothetical protein